ncbi:MAG: cobalamin-dependent protein, partial [Desulfopila sp.]|nr:cobalamin-dependent protein [Desulfopila sp.]
MKKILFINPAYRTNLLDNVRVLALPPLNLMMLAAYTPDSYEIQIVDEIFEDVDFDAAVDLVAITCMTPLAPRAYAISREYRNRGVKVVLGGIHVSMVPEEAQLFADAIVVGEAEEVWPALLRDFDNGRMQKQYQAVTRPDLVKLRPPRRDLLR